MTKSDKACSLMEWNDIRRCSFAEVKEILLWADIVKWIGIARKRFDVASGQATCRRLFFLHLGTVDH